MKIIKDKNIYGQYQIFNTLNKLNGKVLTNLCIPTSDNKTAEINLLLIHRTGIYIIDSKNYTGNIYASHESKYWLQVIDKNMRNRFYSPILQNKKHIKCLKKLLSDLDDKYFNLIILFNNKCNLKIMNIYDNNIKVIKRDFLEETLNKLIKSGRYILTEEEVNSIYDKLKKDTNINKELKGSYIKNFKETY